MQQTTTQDLDAKPGGVSWKTDRGWILAVTAAATLGLALGLSQGAVWADGARDIEYWADRGTGSLGWMDQLAAIATTILGGLLITIVAGIFVGSSRSTWRKLGLVLLVAVTGLATAVGFGSATGLGGALGFPEAELGSGLLAVFVPAMLGSSLGYAIGRRIARRPKPESAPSGR